jgi:hypothetical protein
MRRRKTIIAAAAVVLAMALTAGLFLTSGTDHSALETGGRVRRSLDRVRQSTGTL